MNILRRISILFLFVLIIPAIIIDIALILVIYIFCGKIFIIYEYIEHKIREVNDKLDD